MKKQLKLGVLLFGFAALIATDILHACGRGCDPNGVPQGGRGGRPQGDHIVGCPPNLNLPRCRPSPPPPASNTVAVSWVVGNGVLPAGAVEIGNQVEGIKIHVCRVPVTNGLITGKLAWGNTCFYAFFGKEYSVTQGYEVLINAGDTNLAWRPWNGGADWDVGTGGNRRALVGGSYENRPIVACRANFRGGLVGGHFYGNTCFLPYGGVETPVNNFELLGY